VRESCGKCENFEEMDAVKSRKQHKCALCDMHPSAWSYYAFIICAVAAAWKGNNSKPQPKASLPTLAALAGVQVVKGKFQKFFDLKETYQTES